MATGKPKKVPFGLLDLALTMGACTQCRDNTVPMAGFQRGFKVALIISAKSSNSENTLFLGTLKKQIDQGGLSERHPRV